MKISVIVNNYTLGAYVKCTPIDKIVKQDKFDKSHTEIVYDNINEREKQFIEKILHKKINVLEV